MAMFPMAATQHKFSTDWETLVFFFLSSKIIQIVFKVSQAELHSTLYTPLLQVTGRGKVPKLGSTWNTFVPVRNYKSRYAV